MNDRFPASQIWAKILDVEMVVQILTTAWSSCTQVEFLISLGHWDDIPLGDSYSQTVTIPAEDLWWEVRLFTGLMRLLNDFNGLCGTMWNSKKTMGHQHQPAALRMTEGYGHRSAEWNARGWQAVDTLLTPLTFCCESAVKVKFQRSWIIQPVNLASVAHRLYLPKGPMQLD